MNACPRNVANLTFPDDVFLFIGQWRNKSKGKLRKKEPQCQTTSNFGCLHTRQSLKRRDGHMEIEQAFVLRSRRAYKMKPEIWRLRQNREDLISIASPEPSRAKVWTIWSMKSLMQTVVHQVGTGGWRALRTGQCVGRLCVSHMGLEVFFMISWVYTSPIGLCLPRTLRGIHSIPATFPGK